MTESLQRFVSVPFMGTEIQATADEKHYVSVKPIIEDIGVDWSNALRKIKEDKALNSTMVITTTVGADGKTREMVCLPLNKLNGMLFLINPKEYKSKPEVKKRLEMYRELCFDALYEYFNNGVAVHPAMAVQPSDVQMQAFQKALNDTVDNMTRMFEIRLDEITAKHTREKMWISEHREATAVGRLGGLTKKINRLESEVEDKINEIDELKVERDNLQYGNDRYWDWRRKVGRPRRGYRRPEDYDDCEYLF